MRRQDYPLSDITQRIISCAIEVHKSLGPGLLESVYAKALAHKFDLRGIHYEYEHRVFLRYKGKDVGEHRVDFLVEDVVVIELKATDGIAKIFEAQLLTYLSATGAKVGLIINFNETLLKKGIKRLVL